MSNIADWRILTERIERRRKLELILDYVISPMINLSNLISEVPSTRFLTSNLNFSQRKPDGGSADLDIEANHDETCV